MSMSIKKSKTNEAQPDFDDMMSEVEEELEVQQIEQNIADRVPELRKLNENIDKATTAVIPSTWSDAFVDSPIVNATLHVPDASIDSYKASAPWSSFGKIVALTPEETGIDELKGENGTENSAVYDLSGRRVQKAQKGIFIRDGKVVVK